MKRILKKILSFLMVLSLFAVSEPAMMISSYAGGGTAYSVLTEKVCRYYNYVQVPGGSADVPPQQSLKLIATPGDYCVVTGWELYGGDGGCELKPEANDPNRAAFINKTNDSSPDGGTKTVKVKVFAKKKLTITVRNQKYDYNGKEQGEKDNIYTGDQINDKIEVDDGLEDGDKVVQIALSGTLTEPGSVPITLLKEDFLQIKDASDKSVTDYYDVTIVPGTLTIEKNVTYKVSFDANGGSGKMGPFTVKDQAFELPGCEFTPPEGKQFKCWLVDGKEYAPGKTITLCEDEDTVVKALWEDASEPVHEHSLTLVDKVDATCTEAGSKAYYKCSGCGKWFEDDTALVEITDKSSVIIKALGHKWDGGVVTKAATATKEGVKTYTCLRDSSHTKTETIPATGRKSSGRSEHTASASAAGVWYKDAAGWHYKEAGVLVKDAWRNLSYNEASYWYLFDETGTMLTGWVERDGERYYLYPVSDGWMGRMLTGWQEIDGKWYYFETAKGSSEGRMYRNERTPDGYWVGEDGSWDGSPAG